MRYNHEKNCNLPIRVSGAVFDGLTYLIIALLATLMLLGCGNDKPDPTAQVFIEKAREYVHQNRNWDAITAYENAIKLDPENETAYFERAENYVLVNSIGSAITDYQKAAAINPENSYTKLRLGQIYLTTGKLMEARETILQLIETNPQNIEAYLLYSNIHIREKNFDAAIGTLKKAMLLSRKNIKIMFILASLYKMVEKQDLAETMYEKILAIESTLRLPYMELCKIYRKDKAWDKMETLLLQVLETPGIREVKLTDVARFYEGQKKYNTAQTYYKSAVDEFPQSIQALMNLAEFYTRRNNRDKAIVTMKRAIDLEPNNLFCLVGFTQVYLAFDLPEYSWHENNKAVELSHYNLDANFLVGKLLMEQEDFKGGYTYISWVIRKGFHYAEAYHLKALCTKYQSSKEDEAQKIYRIAAGFSEEPEKFRRLKMKIDLIEALLSDPDILISRMELIEIYLYESNIARAGKHIDVAFSQFPRSPRLLIMLAGLKNLKRNFDGAINIYKDIMKQNPSYLPGLLRLALYYTASGKIDQAIHFYLQAYKIAPQRISILKKISNLPGNKEHYDKILAILNATKIPQHKKFQAFVENLRGEIFLKVGSERKAINSFKAAIAMYPAATAPKINMGRLFIDQKLMLKAKIVFLEIEKEEPNNLAMLMALGFINANNGDLKLAKNYYRRVLAIDAKHGNASNSLAILLMETGGDINEAYTLTAIALDKQPKNPNFHNNMGWLNYQMGHYLGAKSFIKDSLALKPDNPLTCYHMGMVLYRTREFKEARQYFEKALSIDDKFKYADETLKMLTGFGKQINDDTLVNDGRDQLVGLSFNPDDETDVKNPELNNIGLLIDDHKLLDNTQPFYALDTGSDINPGQKIQAKKSVVNFGKHRTYEFAYQFHIPDLVDKEIHDSLYVAENKFTYTIDKKVFSIDNSNPLQNGGWPTTQYESRNKIEPWQPLNIENIPLASIISHYARNTKNNKKYKSNNANNTLEDVAEIGFLINKFDFLNINESKGGGNFFWKLSYNQSNPFVKVSHKFENSN